MFSMRSPLFYLWPLVQERSPYGSDNPNHCLHLGPALIAVFVKGLGFLIFVGLCAKYLLPRLLKSLARSPEMLVLFAIALATALAATANSLGLSKEVGAFLAGVAIAATDYRVPIASRLVSLRDFLLLFFFIELGIHIDLPLIQQQLIPALIPLSRCRKGSRSNVNRVKF